MVVQQFIPKSFLLAGGVELTGGDLPLTYRQHLQVMLVVAARKHFSQTVPFQNTTPKSSSWGDPGVSRPALSSKEDISLRPPGASSIFICFSLLPFPLTCQTWDTGSYYSFSCFLPAAQQRAAAFYQYIPHQSLFSPYFNCWFFLLRYLLSKSRVYCIKRETSQHSY